MFYMIVGAISFAVGIMALLAAVIGVAQVIPGLLLSISMFVLSGVVSVLQLWGEVTQTNALLLELIDKLSNQED